MATQPLPAIRRALLEEILRQLGIAQASIDTALKSATSADVARRLTAQRAEIARVMEIYRAAVAQAMVTSADKVWLGGIDSIAAQTGVKLVGRIDPRALLATQHFMTRKIGEITQDTIQRINTALTQHLLGVRTMDQTLTEIQRLLGGAPRGRAMTIAYTEIGRVYSASQYETMLQQAKLLPGLKKSWIHSGKKHPRPGHVLCAEQTAKEPIPIEQPFEIVDLRTGEVEQLRYPRDPNASAYNTINCGCMMVAVPPSAAELFAQPLTQEQIDAAKPIDGAEGGGTLAPLVPQKVESPAPEGNAFQQLVDSVRARQILRDFERAKEIASATGAPLDEAAALADYTDWGYRDINAALRIEATRTVRFDGEEFAGYVDALTRMIERLARPRVDELTRVLSVRASDLSDFLAEHRVGGIVRYDEFLSTSGPDGEYLGAQNVNVVLDIAPLPDTSRAGVIGRLGMSAEAEVLYRPGTRFRVDGMREESGVFYVRLTELPP